MAVKNPCHPGALVKANLGDLNISVAEAAKALRVTRQQLYNILRGDSNITPDMALRFEKAFGDTADFWLRLQTAYDLALARKHQGKLTIKRFEEHRPDI